MSTSQKTISALINQQLPDFVRADYPRFRNFLEKYYAWLEDETKGNTVYHIMHSEKYRDIDETIDPFIRIFKNELLPYFPERTELDLIKILKNAREFYIKKGSEESVKWLFRVLFNEEIQVYYPKQQILKTSDGKWKLPKAFQLTLSDANQGINPNLLERHKGTGSESTATCIIESANITIDPNLGTEILEIYVSNVFKDFINGENLEIPYTDENGVDQVFVEKIIGAISGIRIDSNIRTDPLQIRRGLLYNVGDPVVVYGGLDSTPQARDAIAYVGNVSAGSIEGVTPVFPGYGYRAYTNTISIVYSSEGDDPNANATTDIRVSGLNLINVAGNSQISFQEYISVDKMPIEYLKTVQIGDGSTEYEVFTVDNRNIVLDATETDEDDVFNTYEDVYANSAGSYLTANFRAQIATSNDGSTFGNFGGGTPYTGDLLLINVHLYDGDDELTVDTANLQAVLDIGGTPHPIYTRTTAKVFTPNSVTADSIPANANSQIIQALTYETLETGGIALYNVIDGGNGFRTTPTIGITSYFDTYLSEAQKLSLVDNDEFLENEDYQTYRQPLGGFGKIAHVYIDNPGTGYTTGDQIVIGDRGYGFVGTVTVNATGSIIRTNITNRGEGYYGPKTVSVSSSGGEGAVLSAYGFGEGVINEINTGAIGRIRDIRLISRGFDYVEAPTVSLKVVDMVVTGVSEFESLNEGERVYQGDSLATATFQGIIKDFNRTTNALRLFNYSGASFNNFDPTLPFTSENGTTFTVDTSRTVTPPAQYPVETQLSGLPNPYFYGNGRGKAAADFFNGLIKYPGFYINTDGFLSADKKIQDSKLYHNYSYIIESNKSIGEYKNVIKDIVHPIGMSMLGRLKTENELNDYITANSTTYINLMNEPGSNITVADSRTNIVTGVSTAFTNTSHITSAQYAVAGDLLTIIDPNNPLRSQAKIITAVNSDTELEVESDFTYIGQGKIRSNIEFTQVTGTVTINPELSVGTVEINSPITGTANVTKSSNVVIGESTVFETDLEVGDTISINNEIRKVVVIRNNTTLEVNTNYRFTSTANDIHLSSNVVTGTSTNFDPEIAVGDIITINNEVRKVTVRTDDTTLVVNTPFNYYATAQSLYKANIYVAGDGTSFTTELQAGDYIKINDEIKSIDTITNDTLLAVNSVFSAYATDANVYLMDDTRITIYGNTNTIFDFINTGDQLSFNIAAANLMLGMANGVADITLEDTQVVGTGTYFTLDLLVGDTIMINNEIRLVSSIDDDENLNVNSAFTSTATGELVYKREYVVNADVEFASGTESGNVLLTNLVINANLESIVYKVVPDYNSVEYDYEILTVTD